MPEEIEALRTENAQLKQDNENLLMWIKIIGEAMTEYPFDVHADIDDVTRWGAIHAIAARAIRHEIVPTGGLDAYACIRDWKSIERKRK